MKAIKMTLLAVLVTIASSAYSQSNSDIVRKGFIFGTSVGGGIYFQDGSTYSRFTIPNLKIGMMLNPKLGIMLYTPGGTFKQEEEERAFEGFLVTAQYWINEGVYFNAGLGLAVETTPFYKVDYSQGPPVFNTGYGFTLSAGKELIGWSNNKTIDIQLRLLYGKISFQDQTQKDNLAIDLVFGFNIY